MVMCWEINLFPWLLEYINDERAYRNWTASPLFFFTEFQNKIHTVREIVTKGF